MALREFVGFVILVIKNIQKKIWTGLRAILDACVGCIRDLMVKIGKKIKDIRDKLKRSERCGSLGKALIVLIKWVVFTLIVSLVPLIVELVLYIKVNRVPFDLFGFGDGEFRLSPMGLVLVSVSISLILASLSARIQASVEDYEMETWELRKSVCSKMAMVLKAYLTVSIVGYAALLLEYQGEFEFGEFFEEYGVIYHAIMLVIIVSLVCIITEIMKAVPMPMSAKTIGNEQENF